MQGPKGPLGEVIILTEQEAREYVEKECNAWWPEDAANYVRYCWHCGNWVPVDDYNGANDKCDNC